MQRTNTKQRKKNARTNSLVETGNKSEYIEFWIYLFSAGSSKIKPAEKKRLAYFIRYYAWRWTAQEEGEKRTEKIIFIELKANAILFKFLTYILSISTVGVDIVVPSVASFAGWNFRGGQNTKTNTFQ